MSPASRFTARLALTAAVLTLLWGAPGLAAELEDLAGDWAVMVQLPDAPQMAGLHVEKGPESGLLATLNSPLGEAKIDDIELVEGKHVLTYMMDLGGQPMDIEVSVQVEGDKFDGHVLVGGGAMDLPIEGARTGTEAETALQTKLAELQAAAAAAAPAAADGASTATAQTVAVPATADAATTTTATTAAAEPAAELSRLAVADAQDLLGDWILKVATFRGDNYVDFKATDDGGFVLAQFTLPPPMTVDPIRYISRVNGEFVMKFVLNFGSSVIDMTMKLHPENDRYIGTLVDANNMFNSEVALLTVKQAEEEKEAKAAAAPDGDGDGGDDDAESQRQNLTIKLGEKEVRVNTPQPKAEGADFDRLAALEAGQVVRFTFDFAISLRTEVPLKFGEVLVPTDNVAPNYPGVYSLWLEKSADGWVLRFNNRPDIWGTQHDAAADGPAVPLTVTNAEQPAAVFTSTLEQQGEGGRLTFAWGNQIWSADFTAAP